jgi:hypothetical protein
MPDYEVHEPAYDDTTEEDRDDSRLNEFDISERSSDGTRDPLRGSRDTDDPGEVAEHVVLSSSGFPPENFSDLQIPVVDPGETSTSTRSGPLTQAATASRRPRGSTTTPPRRGSASTRTNSSRPPIRSRASRPAGQADRPSV